LSTGAVLELAIGAHATPGQSEQDLFRGLWGTLRPGDVLLADALYCSYFQIATLQAAGVDVLVEQNGSRITDFRRGQALGRRDHVVRWLKPAKRPQWMSREEYRAFPEQLTVRETKVAGHLLVTTMLDARAVCKSELARLYAQRWHVELDLRNIKTTVGMEVVWRLGDSAPKKIDARVICATNRSLPTEIEGGRFRVDLYHRINVARLTIPPLRDRRSDIPALVHHLLGKNLLGEEVSIRVSPEVMERFMSYSWLRIHDSMTTSRTSPSLTGLSVTSFSHVSRTDRSYSLAENPLRSLFIMCVPLLRPWHV
jgi:hypothetical protein